MAKKKRGGRSARPDSERHLRQADRFARIMRVLELIQGNGRWDAAALAKELECSERTIYRALEVLTLSGIPWRHDVHQRCFRVDQGFKFPVMNLSEQELLDQVVATSVAAAPGVDAGAGARATTRKLAATSHTDAQRLLADARRMIEVLDLKLTDHSKHRDTIQTIQKALLEGKQLAGMYESPYLDSSLRLTLHPYRLCLLRQSWYLIARASKDSDPKTYRVPRFKALRQLEKPSLVPEDFDIGEYFGNAWSVFRAGEDYDVEIRFTKDAATQVTETKWHHTQQVKRYKDGSATLTFRVDGLEEILWWLLGWTGFAEVVSPVELRTLLVEQLQNGIAMNCAD